MKKARTRLIENLFKRIRQVICISDREAALKAQGLFSYICERKAFGSRAIRFYATTLRKHQNVNSETKWLFSS